MKPRQWDVREPDVDRLPFHVEAAARDALAVGVEHGVSGGGPIAGNDLERLGRSRRAAQLMQQIKEARVDDVNVAGPEIAEEVIHLGEGPGQVPAACEVL